jgi:hypothetical protein
MKQIAFFLFVFLSISGFSQTDTDLIGRWVVTDYSNLESSEDFWEFTSDGVFNELKDSSEGNKPVELIPDETGTWELDSNKLIIKVIGEKSNGLYKEFDKPQILKFELMKHQGFFILRFIENSGSNRENTLQLKLTELR